MKSCCCSGCRSNEVNRKKTTSATKKPATMQIELELNILYFSSNRVLCSTTCQRYDCRDFIDLHRNFITVCGGSVPVHIHFHSTFFSCYCSFLTSFQSVFSIYFSHFKNIAHTHSIFTVDMSICISFNNKLFHSNIFTSFSIKYFHRCIYCMRESVDIILFTLKPHAAVPPLALCSHSQLFFTMQQKGESLQHRISHRPTYLLHIYIIRIENEKRKMTALECRKQKENRDTYARHSGLNRIPWWAMRWAKNFCVGNNDQKS